MRFSCLLLLLLLALTFSSRAQTPPLALNATLNGYEYPFPVQPLPGVGHIPHLGATSQFLAALLAFVQLKQLPRNCSVRLASKLRKHFER